MTHHPTAPARYFRTWRLPLGLLALLPCLLLIFGAPARAASSPESARAEATAPIAVLDWTLAETLLALGVTPRGVAQIDAYHDWVGAPHMPDAVTDIGLRAQPNLELLAGLDLERILISPMFSALAPRLSHIAPVETMSIYLAEGDTWSNLLATTRELARLTGRPAAAQELIDATREHLDQLRQRLPETSPPLLMVQFMDARHVRVFGDNSLYQVVLERLGLDNAWTGPTNRWGFSLVALEALAGIDAQLVVIEPLPVGVEAQLAESGLWHSLDAVRDGDVIRLAPVWSFGGLPSARRFADLLVTALVDASTPATTRHAAAPSAEGEHD